MSGRAKSPKIDLKLNISPRGAAQILDSPRLSDGTREASPESSCVSSEPESSSPEERTMVLAGCPKCLMYVMLYGKDPRFPKCKSPVLLDIPDQENNRRTRNY